MYSTDSGTFLHGAHLQPLGPDEGELQQRFDEILAGLEDLRLSTYEEYRDDPILGYDDAKARQKADDFVRTIALRRTRQTPLVMS